MKTNIQQYVSNLPSPCVTDTSQFQSYLKSLFNKAIHDIQETVKSLNSQKKICNLNQLEMPAKSPPILLWLDKEINRLIQIIDEKQTQCINNNISKLKTMKSVYESILSQKKITAIIPRFDLLSINIKNDLLFSTYHERRCYYSLYCKSLSIIRMINSQSAVFQPVESLPPPFYLLATLEYLHVHFDKFTGWFPKSSASDRLGKFILARTELICLDSRQTLMKSIRKCTDFLLTVTNATKALRSICYLVCYRALFDLAYPKFSASNNNSSKKLPESTLKRANLTPKAQEQFDFASQILQMSLFETNPIDIGYVLTSVNKPVANIINIEKDAAGKEIDKLIPADETLEVWEALLYENNFTYAIDLLDILDYLVLKEIIQNNFDILVKLYVLQHWKCFPVLMKLLKMILKINH